MKTYDFDKHIDKRTIIRHNYDSLIREVVFREQNHKARRFPYSNAKIYAEAF